MANVKTATYKLLVALAALLLSGCSGGYLIRVNAVAPSPPHSGMRYVLVGQDTREAAQGATSPHVAGHLKKVLAELRYTEAESLPSADIAIFLSYGLRRPPSYRDSLTIPDEEDEIGAMIPFRVSTWTSGGALGTGDASYGRSMAGIPLPWKTSRKIYERSMTLEAMDGPAYRDGKTTLVWKVRAISMGYSTDLGKVVPAMLDACKPFIGTTTQKEVEVRGR
jgi:hypothetical protein